MQTGIDNLDTAELEESQENRKRSVGPPEQEGGDMALLTGVQKIRKRRVGIGQSLKNIEVGQTKLVKIAQELKRELHITNHQLQKYASAKAIALASRRKEQISGQVQILEAQEKTNDFGMPDDWTQRKAQGKNQLALGVGSWQNKPAIPEK